MLELKIKIDQDNLQVNQPYNATLTFNDAKVKECTCKKEEPRFKIFDEVSEEGQLPFRFSMKKIDDDSIIVEYINKKYYDDLQNKVIELTEVSKKAEDLLHLVNYYRNVINDILQVDTVLIHGRNI